MCHDLSISSSFKCPKILNLSLLTHDEKSRAGYTLIEVVMAMMIFAIVAMSVSLPFAKSLSLSYNDNCIAVANNLAKIYLKDVEMNWQTQQNFTAGELVPIDSTYTGNGLFSVTADSEDLITDGNGNVLIKRVNIKYSTQNGQELIDLFLDINKPGMNHQ